METSSTISGYLQRIRYHGPVEPTVDTLQRLHRAHLYAVPFENLDIHYGQKIVLSRERLFDKIVGRRRGGFCYELNGLFAWLLHGLGFEVQMLSAGVAREEGGFGPEFDHMTLLVHLEQRWLADVGFGDSFMEPLRFDDREIQIQQEGAYRILEGNGARLIYQREYDQVWVDQYSFTLQPWNLEDYFGMCEYHQTSPQSSFTRKRVCSLATNNGRITLSDLKLIETVKGSQRETILESEVDFRRILQVHFGIVL